MFAGARVLTILIVILVTTACASQPAATPTPVPTPTPTFEQKRNDVSQYLKAFNAIENSFDQTSSQVQMPRNVRTASELVALNAALTQMLTALDGANRRLDELSPARTEPEAATHLEKARAHYRSIRQTLDSLRQAIASGGQQTDPQLFSKAQSFAADASALNRATEQIMLKYNVADGEVSYKFRGK